jgi:hypothetical protein
MASKKAHRVHYRPPPQFPFPRLRRLTYYLHPFRALRIRANVELYGGRRGVWFWLSVGFLGTQALRRGLTRTPQLAAREVLKPGQSLVLTTIAPPTRRDRRQARKT